VSEKPAPTSRKTAASKSAARTPAAEQAPPARARTASPRKAPPRKAAARKAPSAQAATSPAAARTEPRRDVDLVVFGATGFTGRLVAEYLSRKAPDGVRIGLAGRTEGKVRRVRQRLGGPSHRWPVIVADSTDQASLDAMAARTRAVVTTVGPYADDGIHLVRACAENGTHYADLTGEVTFMRDSIDRFDKVARSNGARIVHSCGFDSIPSDLGVLALHLAARADGGDGRLGETRLVVMSMRGGVSGGTIASMFGQLDAAKDDPAVARMLADPYALSPDRRAEPKPGDGRDPRGPAKDEVVGRWTAPFPMGPINTRVVRRSNALLGHAYGRDFRYSEAIATGSGVLGRLAANGLAVGELVGTAALGFGPTRAIASRFLPSQGEGPGRETRESGSFDMLVHTRTPAGTSYRCRVTGQGDPGYAATSRMLAVSGLTLAGDATLLPDVAGVLTPAAAMGKTLIDNLKVAQITFTATRD
jgi:short subunit dehydrogenase-like uncharacterized protein